MTYMIVSNSWGAPPLPGTLLQNPGGVHTAPEARLWIL